MNQKGFSLIETLLVMLIVSVLGFTGWLVWHNKVAKKPAAGAKYSISYDWPPVPCDSFKSPAVDAAILKSSNDTYIKAGFSQKFINSHFKLRAVDTNVNTSTDANGVVTQDPQTRLTWEICYGSRAVVTHYDYQHNPALNSIIYEDPDNSGLHDINSILDYQQAGDLLNKCSNGTTGKDLRVGFTTPLGHNESPGPGIYIYASGPSTTHGAFTNWTDYYVNLETGKCSKLSEGAAA